MQTSRIVRSVVTLSFALLLLGYFIAAASTAGALRDDGRGHAVISLWHVCGGLSVCLGTLVLLTSGADSTLDCRMIAIADYSIFEDPEQDDQIKKVARTVCLLEGSCKMSFLMGMLLGWLIFTRTPARLGAWYEIAHKQLISIQGPGLVAWIWIFYIAYAMLMRRQVASLWKQKLS